MGKYFQRMGAKDWVAWAFYLLAALVAVGGLIWHFATWPSAFLLIIGAIIRLAGRNPNARNAQENDPNRR
ncbi:hypothetical protein ACVXZ4_09850 [Lacisediminihabitans sp. FW035]